MKIIVSPHLLDHFMRLTESDSAVRMLLDASVPHMQQEWFDSNHKLLIEGQRKAMWPAGFDCINWPEMKFVAEDGHTVNYPIDVVPCWPDWIFIVCSNDPKTIPGQGTDGLLYVTDYPECMNPDKEIEWLPWKLTNRLGVRDGQHRTKGKLA